MRILRHLMAIPGLAISLSVVAQPISVEYEFTITGFDDGIWEGTPSPVESVSGSFGFTFEPNTGDAQIPPDFVNLSILGVDYSTTNTAVLISDGSVNAITFGNPVNGVNVVSRFSDDFLLVFFVDDGGNVFGPGVHGTFLLSDGTLSDTWLVSASNVAVTQALDPEVLLQSLVSVVIGVGPGMAMENKIALALALLESGNDSEACNELEGFVNHVMAQSGKKISLQFAEQLVTEAGTIMDSIGCD